MKVSSLVEWNEKVTYPKAADADPRDELTIVEFDPLKIVARNEMLQRRVSD